MRIFMSVLTSVVSFSTIAVLATTIGCFEKPLPVEENGVRQNNDPPSSDANNTSVSDGKQPKAVLKDLEFDFGSMLVGEEMEHSFTIRNEGDAPLKLKLGHVSCQCASTQFENAEVAPGEEFSFEVSWHAMEPKELFHQTAEVETNDPENPSIRFTIKGTVARTLDLHPSGDWRLGNVSTDATEVSAGRVISLLVDEFKITEVTTDHEMITARTEPAFEDTLNNLNAKMGHEVILDLSPELPYGPFQATVKLVTDLNDNATVSVNVFGVKSRPILLVALQGTRFIPSTQTIHLGAFPADSGKSAKLSVFVRDMKEPFEITEVTTEPEFIKATATMDEAFVGTKSQRYEVLVEVPPDSPKVSLLRDDPGSIMIKTNHPKQPELNLRIEMISQ